jgi:hypothetical protein
MISVLKDFFAALRLAFAPLRETAFKTLSKQSHTEFTTL